MGCRKWPHVNQSFAANELLISLIICLIKLEHNNNLKPRVLVNYSLNSHTWGAGTINQVFFVCFNANICQNESNSFREWLAKSQKNICFLVRFVYYLERCILIFRLASSRSFKRIILGNKILYIFVRLMV